MKPKRVAIVGATWPLYEQFCPNFVGMSDGLTRLGIEHQIFNCRPTLDIRALYTYAPDLVVYGLVDMVKRFDYRREIRSLLPNAKIVFWYGDLRNWDKPQIRGNLSEIDAMFVSNAAQNQYYEQEWRVPQCHYLPLGSPLWDVTPDERYAYDFLFIGGRFVNHGLIERKDIIDRFKTDGDLKIIDAPTSEVQNRAKILRNMPILYRSSKVVLDYSHYTDIPGYTSNRFWIIAGAGGFALTKRWPGCTDFYPEGTRVYFDTFEEAIALRDYYLAHPEERERIRLAGHKHARNHTYDHRFAIMFNVLYGTNRENRPPLTGTQTPGTPVEKNPAKGIPETPQT